jgi:hypothetical protein
MNTEASIEEKMCKTTPLPLMDWKTRTFDGE